MLYLPLLVWQKHLGLGGERRWNGKTCVPPPEQEKEIVPSISLTSFNLDLCLGQVIFFLPNNRRVNYRVPHFNACLSIQLLFQISHNVLVAWMWSVSMLGIFLFLSSVSVVPPVETGWCPAIAFISSMVQSSVSMTDPALHYSPATCLLCRATLCWQTRRWIKATTGTLCIFNTAYTFFSCRYHCVIIHV